MAMEILIIIWWRREACGEGGHRIPVEARSFSFFAVIFKLTRATSIPNNLNPKCRRQLLLGWLCVTGISSLVLWTRTRRRELNLIASRLVVTALWHDKWCLTRLPNYILMLYNADVDGGREGGTSGNWSTFRKYLNNLEAIRNYTDNCKNTGREREKYVLNLISICHPHANTWTLNLQDTTTAAVILILVSGTQPTSTCYYCITYCLILGTKFHIPIRRMILGIMKILIII